MKKSKFLKIVTLFMTASVILGTTVSISGCTSKTDETAFYVSTKGSDENAGTKKKPFATPEKAIKAVRDVIAQGLEKPVTVYFMKGEYKTEGLTFTDADSGTKEFPVTYKAYKNDKVVFTGGMTLANKDFTSVSDENVLSRLKANAKDKIKAVDLKKYGITKEMVGPVYATGTYNQGDAPKGSNVGLSWNGVNLDLARYPNNGYLGVADVIDNGDPEKSIPGTIKMDEETRKLVSTWKNLDDVWTFGFWTFNWADNTTPVDVWDIENGTMKFKYAYYYGYKQDARYYFYNVLEELDAPGEYYIDRENLIAYVYPPEGADKEDALISIYDKPIVKGEKLSNVTFEGIKFAGSRDCGIVISDADNITVRNCVVSNLNGDGIIINGENNSVLDCEICYVGKRGVSVMGGGDCATFRYANNLVENNYVHHFSQVQKTYTAGIQIGDIGSRVAHNEIAYAPHSALSYTGPENIIEYNYVHDVVQDSDDAGALYAGGSHRMYGTQIRYNYFKNIGSEGMHAKAIYLDDGMSGAIVHGNIVENAGGDAIIVGGGRCNTITNNLMINCGGDVYYDDRFGDKGYNPQSGLYPDKDSNPWYKDLCRVPYDNELWVEKYPLISKMKYDAESSRDKDYIFNPSYAVIKNNVSIGCKSNWNISEDVKLFTGFFMDIYGNKEFSVKNVVLEDDSYIVKTDAVKVHAVEWEQIDFNKIGRYSESNPRTEN